MSKEGTGAPATKCRPRYKGIENFLRRVAYNLGNSPSQTEVKIISCIPIDVSDMQNKIISLERELETKRMCPTSMPMEARMVMVEPHRPTSALHAPAEPAQTSGGAPPVSNSPSCCRDQVHPPGSFRSKKSCVSFMYPSLTSEPSSRIPVNESPNKVTSYPCPSECEDEDCERSRGLLKSLKRIASSNKKKEKDKCKTHYVYYAETMNSTNSPFTNYNRPVNSAIRVAPQKDSLDRSYLASMVRKQYRAEKFVKDPSDTSQFSSPICRDVSQSCATAGLYDSDACSCCHGPFQNIDHTMRHSQDVFTIAPVTRSECVNSMYYDSSLYDLVPVREKPPKAKFDEEISKKRELKNQEFRNCLEQSRIRSRNQPYAVNYHNITRVNRKSGYKRKLATKSPIRIAPKRKYFEQQINMGSSNSCSVDCGGVYIKPSHNMHRTPKTPEPVKTVLLKNAECLTISVNNTECQTASSKSVQLETPSALDENKTEITLNQIKTILQSVLTEVKTNAQVNKTIAEDIPRKDAVVQKGPSQSNIQTCSSLLNSFTYSPYNINPFMMPSCSRQINNPLCYPNTPYSPAKCLQNYPLFIQTGRQCTCCFRNIPGAAKSSYNKQTTVVASTNTEAAVSQHRNKETEKLIKEIYKSIAVNMDYPAKNSSTSEYDDLKSSKDNSQKVFEFKFIPSKEKRKDFSSSDTNRIKDIKENRTSTTSPETKVNFGSNVVSNTASTRSHLVTKTTAEQLRDQRIANYLMKREQLSSESDRREARASARSRVPYVVELPNATTITSDDTVSPESDDFESDDTVVTVQQPAKKKSGLFSKVAKLFKTKSKKQKEKKIVESEKGDEQSESEASDSDDYQTICTHPSRKQSKHVTYMRDRPRYKPRPHSKVSYSRYYMHHKEKPQERGRRTPYMEQEYRRHWNENLAFHGGRSPKYSSERPFSKESVLHSRREQPAYYRNYEARPAIIRKEPREAISLTERLIKQGDYKVPDETVVVKSAKAVEWLKRYKQGLCGCGREWKRFLLES